MTPSPEGRQEAAVLDVKAILPCPFCGAKAIHRETIEHYNDEDGAGDFSCRHSVACDDCGIEVSEEYAGDAIAAWNRRALIPVKPAVEVVEALKDAEETLRLVEHPAFRDPRYGDEVEALGLRIGFGALMSSASASWREYLASRGTPVGGEYVAGPCHGTVVATLAKIRAALQAPATPDAQTEVEK